VNWSVVVAVYNDEAVLNSTLLRSPALQSATRVFYQKGFVTVAKAYNAAIRESAEDILVFLHPDVYLPAGWPDALRKSLDWLQENDPTWGVSGLLGVTQGGSIRGFTYSTGRGGFIGVPFAEPCEVRTLDEFVLILRRSSGLCFDERLPSVQNQLSATDLCLEARSRGMASYVLPCFALHNSNRWRNLPIGFWRCYLYMRQKWRAVLPIDLPYAKITASCLPMIKSTIRILLRFPFGNLRVVTRVSDPEALYEQLRRDLLALLGEYPIRMHLSVTTPSHKLPF